MSSALSSWRSSTWASRPARPRRPTTPRATCRGFRWRHSSPGPWTGFCEQTSSRASEAWNRASLLVPPSAGTPILSPEKELPAGGAEPGAGLFVEGPEEGAAAGRHAGGGKARAAAALGKNGGGDLRLGGPGDEEDHPPGRIDRAVGQRDPGLSRPRARVLHGEALAFGEGGGAREERS